MSATASSSTRTSGRASPARTTLSPASSIVSSSPISPGGAGFRGARRSPSAGRGSVRSSGCSIEGPRADALLLAGWLRSRLRRKVSLTRRDADALAGIAVDGDPVDPAGPPCALRQRPPLRRARRALRATRSTRPRCARRRVDVGLAVLPRRSSRTGLEQRRRGAGRSTRSRCCRRSAARRAKSVNVPPASSTITCTAARSHTETPIASIAPSIGALGDEHVAPEVAVAAGVPGAARKARQRLLEREA